MEVEYTLSTFKVGDVRKLTIKKPVDDGYILTDESTDVFLKTENELEVGDQIEVFLYHNQSGEIVASAEIPTVQLTTFDWGEVVRVIQDLGVFVDIGANIEVLLSNDDLSEYKQVWPIVGDQVYISLKLDKKDRLLAEPVREGDFEGTWENAPENLFNQDIKGRVFRSGREGAALITEDGYRGFVHHTERKEEPRVGEWVEGRVIKVKENGTLNISLLPRKQEAQADDAEKIKTYLEENNGEIPIDNKSGPDLIRETFDMSKSAFKRAIGKLYKERLIKQEEGKTILIDTDDQ